MRKLACLIVIVFCTLASAQVPAALALFPVVVRFIGHVLHIGSSSNATGQLDMKQTPGIAIDIPGASIHPAQQLCQNWTWAAAVETILAAQSVPLTQD
jgi:hypothetical protein